MILLKPGFIAIWPDTSGSGNYAVRCITLTFDLDINIHGTN